MRVRAARGAIVTRGPHADDVLTATERLLRAVLTANAIAPEDLVSILFTATEDLRSAFPAEAARRMGMGSVPLLCAQEDTGGRLDGLRGPRPPALLHRASSRRGRSCLPRRRGEPPR